MWGTDTKPAWPLAQCFAWYSAIAVRHDLEPSGPGYIDQDIMAALERLEKLTTHVPDPVPKPRRRSGRRR